LQIEQECSPLPPSGNPNSKAGDVLETYGNHIPIFIGTSSSDRWEDAKAWMATAGGNMSYHKVTCKLGQDRIRGVIDCHVAVAKAALAYFSGRPGVYIDLEDNCHPTLRCDWQVAYDAAELLRRHPQWKFVHLSRFPTPFGVVNPHFPVTGSLFWKSWTYNELAQAMLCHTEFASMISNPEFGWTEPYDDQLMQWQRYAVYPSLFQRWTESHTASHATFITAMGLMRDIAFQPWIYAFCEVVNVFGLWLVITLMLAGCGCWCSGSGSRDGARRGERKFMSQAAMEREAPRGKAAL